MSANLVAVLKFLSGLLMLLAWLALIYVGKADATELVSIIKLGLGALVMHVLVSPSGKSDPNVPPQKEQSP